MATQDEQKGIRVVPRRAYATTRAVTAPTSPSGGIRIVPKGAATKPRVSPTEAVKMKKGAEMQRDVLRTTARAGAYSKAFGVEGPEIPNVRDPALVDKLAKPPWYRQVVPFLGKGLSTVGQVLEPIDRFFPLMRPLRGALYESVNEFTKGMKDPNYNVKQATLAPLRGVWNALSGKEKYLGEDTLKPILGKLGQTKLLPILGAAYAAAGDTPLANVLMPDIAKQRQEIVQSSLGQIQKAMGGEGAGPTISQILGFGADLALPGAAAGQLPKGLLSIGRRTIKLGEAVPTVTPETKAVADALNKARPKAKYRIKNPALQKLDKVMETSQAARDYIEQRLINVTRAKKYKPVNVAERKLDEVMTAAKQGPIDTEITITNARQARKYLQDAFGTTADDVARMSDAEAVNLALEAQQARVLPTATERVARAASERGTTLDDLVSRAAKTPMQQMRETAERLRLARVAGVDTAPLPRLNMPQSVRPRAPSAPEIVNRTAAEMGLNAESLFAEASNPGLRLRRLGERARLGRAAGIQGLTPKPGPTRYKVKSGTLRSTPESSAPTPSTTQLSLQDVVDNINPRTAQLIRDSGSVDSAVRFLENAVDSLRQRGPGSEEILRAYQNALDDLKTTVANLSGPVTETNIGLRPVTQLDINLSGEPTRRVPRVPLRRPQPPSPAPVQPLRNIRDIKNPFIQPEKVPVYPVETSVKGLEVLGEEVITSAQAKNALSKVGEALRPLASTELGQKVTRAANKVNQAFNRRYVPPGAPKSVGEIPSVLDRQGDLTHRTEKEIIGRLRPVIGKVNPTKGEMTLLYHMRDLGKPFTLEGATQAVQEGFIDPSILQNLTQERLSLLKTVDDAFQYEYSQILAPMQREAGIELTERPNYVTHIIGVNKDAADAFVDAFPNQAMALQQHLSGDHRFLNPRKLPTLAQAKAANAQARAKGLVEPFTIGTEDYLDAFSRYTQAALAAVKNRNVFKDIAARYPDLISYTKDAPGRGWVSANMVPGMQEALGGNVKAWLHPSAAEKLADELVKLNSLGGAGKALGGFFGALDSVSNIYRGLYTSYRFPKFQIRNLLDNTFKRWLFDALGNDGEAIQILRGVDEVISLPKPMQVRDFVLQEGKWQYSPGSVSNVQELTGKQWRDLFTVTGLTETGQFGRHGDIATTLRHELGKGKLGTIADLPKDVGRATEDASKIALALSKGQEIGDLMAGVQEANRILFRYSDLAPFERDAARPASLFYTFQRKNIPLMGKALLERPEKFGKLGLVREELRDKRVDESALPDYQRNEFTIPLRTGDNTYVLNPGFSMGDAFRALPHRWPETAAGMANPILANTFLGTAGVDRTGRNLKDLPPAEPPGWMPDGVAMALIPNAMRANGRVVIPGSARYWLDQIASGAPRELGAILEADEPDESKVDAILKFLTSSFGKSYSMQDLQNRKLGAARRNIEGKLKGIEAVTQVKPSLEKLAKLREATGKR